MSFSDSSATFLLNEVTGPLPRGGRAPRPKQEKGFLFGGSLQHREGGNGRGRSVGKQKLG